MTDVRRKWISWLVSTIVTMVVCSATAQVSAPNIILITADTFRPDRLGYYHSSGLGTRESVSPHLDTLSSQGVFFRKAFTTSAWTTPGLISIHTSLYAPVHGVDVRGRSLDPAVTTLAEALAAAGYRTPDVFFLSDLPNFSHLGMDESFPERSRYLRDGDEVLFHWLENESPKDDRPFFLYYHYRELHQPYAPGAEFEEPRLRDAFGSSYNPLSWLARQAAADKMALVQREIMLVRERVEFDAADSNWVRALYDAQISRMDEEFFRRLRSALVEAGLAQNTLLLISADHGEELLDHGLIGHASTYQEGRLYDELIRIPLIAWWPGRLPAGRIVDEPVQCIDVMPTVLELAGVQVPEEVEGRSLLPLIAGSPGWEQRPIFCETSGGGYTADEKLYADRTRAVRTQRWKLIRSVPGDGSTPSEELYDLDSDPYELDNVVDDFPNRADSLRALLQSWSLQSQVRQVMGEGRPPTEPSAAARRVHAHGAPVDDGVPQVLYPQSGDTLQYVGVDQIIQLRWTGEGDTPYVIEYSVGEGSYHLEGELSVVGNEPAYGPFHSTFWNSLVLYNPWHFRVRRASASGDSSSVWVTFVLAPTQAAGGSGGTGALLMAAMMMVSQGGSEALRLATEMFQLGRGLIVGLFELAVLATSLPVADVSAWLLIGAIIAAAVWPRVRAALGLRRCRLWGLTLAYIGVVYCTLGVFPSIWRRLTVLTEGSIKHLGTVVAIVTVASLLWRIGRRVGRQSWTPYIVMALTTAAYVYLLYALSRFPAERLHLLEYGLLAYLILRALQLDLADRPAYAWSLVLTTIVGLGDEIIQLVLPQRFFEFKDVFLNMVSGGLALLLVRFAIDYQAGSHPSRRLEAEPPS